MPAHQFPTRWSLYPRSARPRETGALSEPHFRHGLVRERSGSRTELDPPPAYTETSYHARRHRSASHTEQPSDQTAREEKRKGSWNVIETVEQKYWRLSTSKNAILRWSLEIFSWTISAMCMGTIILVLVLTEGKAQPSWDIEACVSMVSRVATSALLLPTAEAIGELKWSAKALPCFHCHFAIDLKIGLTFDAGTLRRRCGT